MRLDDAVRASLRRRADADRVDERDEVDLAREMASHARRVELPRARRLRHADPFQVERYVESGVDLTEVHPPVRVDPAVASRLGFDPLHEALGPVIAHLAAHDAVLVEGQPDAIGAATVKNLPATIKFFSDITGVKYPYPKYAQTFVEDFGGGMDLAATGVSAADGSAAALATRSFFRSGLVCLATLSHSARSSSLNARLRLGATGRSRIGIKVRRFIERGGNNDSDDDGGDERPGPA